MTQPVLEHGLRQALQAHVRSVPGERDVFRVRHCPMHVHVARGAWGHWTLLCSAHFFGKFPFFWQISFQLSARGLKKRQLWGGEELKISQNVHLVPEETNYIILPFSPQSALGVSTSSSWAYIKPTAKYKVFFKEVHFFAGLAYSRSRRTGCGGVPEGLLPSVCTC